MNTPPSDALTTDPKLMARRIRMIKPVLISGLEPDILRRAAEMLEASVAVSESVALDLLKEARPYLDLIEPSVSKERPLVMVVTKCDAEALAKRIDALIGEKA